MVIQALSGQAMFWKLSFLQPCAIDALLDKEVCNIHDYFCVVHKKWCVSVYVCVCVCVHVCVVIWDSHV